MFKCFSIFFAVIFIVCHQASAGPMDLSSRMRLVYDTNELYIVDTYTGKKTLKTIPNLKPGSTESENLIDQVQLINVAANNGKVVHLSTLSVDGVSALSERFLNTASKDEGANHLISRLSSRIKQLNEEAKDCVAKPRRAGPSHSLN